MLKDNILAGGVSSHAYHYLFRSMSLLVGCWLLWRAARFFEVAPFVSGFYSVPKFVIASICLYDIRYLPALVVATVVGALTKVPLLGYSVGFE